MGSFKTFLLSSSFFLLSYVAICVVSLEPAKCRGKEIKMQEKDTKIFSGCVKEIGGSDTFKDVPKEKMPCVGKCILMKRGLLNDKGIPVKDNIIGMINATMPAEVIPELDKAMGDCIDQSVGNVDHGEENCLSYQPLCECVMKTFMTVCKEDKDKKVA